MALVTLHMDLHCLGCAKKIHRAVKKIHGVGSVRVSPETGLVTVAGSVDASELKRRIGSKVTSGVTIVSDGGEVARDYWWRAHLALPPPQYAPPPQGYTHYAGMVHLAPPHYATPPHYAAPPPAYPYDEAPVCFNDENPNGCCVMQ